jgi:uncharacterized protein (TIGR03435 family)
MIPQSFAGVTGALADFGPALANHLWQSTVFAAVAGVLTLALRKNHARARYWLWMAASVKFLVPFALLITIGSHLVKPHQAATAQAGMVVAMEDVSEPFALPETPMVAAPVAKVDWAALLPVACGVVWLGGFAAVLCLWCVRWRRVAAGMREAVAMREGRELEALRRLERASGIGTRIELLLSPSSMEPGVFGIARPILAWPARISERLDDAHLAAVLAHEVCHVRRRDNLTAAIHMVDEAVFWFYPLVWWLGARLVEERERACDEEVLELCKQPEVYAESILTVCEFCVESPLACVSGVTGADLKQRIVEIMTERVVCKLGLGRKLLLVTVGLAVVAAPILLGQVKGTRRMAFAALKSAAALQPLTPAPAVHAAPSQTIATTAPIEISQASAAPVVPTQTSATPVVPTQTSAAPVADKAPAPATAAAKPIPFEVISIRQNISRRVSGLMVTPDGFSTEGSAVIRLLRMLGNIDTAALPGWSSTERYDVEAKIAESDIASWQKLGYKEKDLSIRTLLEDRFAMKWHIETKMEPGYELVIAKSGSKLKEATPGETYPNGTKNPDGTSWHGVFMSGPSKEAGITGFSGQAATMDQLSGQLRMFTRTPVVDKTGLTSTYDFTLNAVPEPLLTAGDTTPPVTDGPSVFSAVQQQLGLKLESVKVPVEYLVVDHIERPSEN